MSSEARGQLFVFSAPSGAGKTTLVRRVMRERPELTFSISYTTRPRREGEVDGRDYHFLSRESFERMREAGEFLEYADVFGNYYGTGRHQVADMRDNGRDVLLEIDWQGARQVRENQPDCCSIFIMPPSMQELERRLRGRATDSEAVITRRLGEAVEDMAHWDEFDHVVINDDIDAAARQLLAAMDGPSDDTSTRNPEVRARMSRLLGRTGG